MLDKGSDSQAGNSRNSFTVHLDSFFYYLIGDLKMI